MIQILETFHNNSLVEFQNSDQNPVHLMYLPLKFPICILIKIIEQFHKIFTVNYSCFSNQNFYQYSRKIPQSSEF